MFRLRRGVTVIAEGVKIIGNVAVEGSVEVNGQVEGEVQCTSLIVSPKGLIKGGVQANRVVVNGKVEGPIRGREVLLKPHAIVVGDIQAQALSVENGAYFDGHSMRGTERSETAIPVEPSAREPERSLRPS